MFNRAQRDWLPLVTSHIRLRNLIRISAHNLTLHCDNSLALLEAYFTLHLSAFSKPFYTSSCVEVRNGKISWPEIYCELCRESSQEYICIRVWQKSGSSITTADKMLFLWGVYFSGLVLVPKVSRNNCEDSAKFKENTLLFQLDGGVFTSSDQIIYHVKSECDTDSIPITTTTKTIEKSESNCDKTTTHNLSNGNNENISASPHTTLVQEEDEKASNAMDILINYPKVRYVQLKFPRNEMQQSYTLERLIQIQEIQREIIELRKQTKVIAERICMKSPACLKLDLITTAKPIFYEQKQSGMGRALREILTPIPPKPEVLLKSQELRIKIECTRFRIKLLSQERDRCRRNNKQLEAMREKLKDDNTDSETFIWNNRRTLNRENLRAYDEKLALQRETFTNVKLALLETRRNLLKDLNEIYYVKKCDRSYTINGIHLPDAESYSDTQVTAVEISVALGYVAHCVLIISRILNVPLRNQIKHEGSRSRILDTVKILPPTDRTFPLFCRSVPPSNVLLYGVYLLNQNISQLKFMLGMSRGDLRATLANLWDLMNGLNAEMYSRRFVEDVRPIDNSASSMDSVPLHIPLSCSPISRRKSRSLEDFDSLGNSRENINASAPDLTNVEEDLEQN